MAKSRKLLSRRKFFIRSASVAAGSVLAAGIVPALAGSRARAREEFRSSWHECHDRVWLGEQYWANPLHQWRLAGGRAELTEAAADRNIHLLVRDLSETTGDVQLSVQAGRVGGGSLGGDGSFGFRIGISGPLREYRNSLFNGSGLDCGVTGDGGMFIGDIRSAEPGLLKLDGPAVELRLHGVPNGERYRLELSVFDVGSGKLLGKVERSDINPGQLVGNVALVCNYPVPAADGARGKKRAKQDRFGKFWFTNWRVSGSKVAVHDERAFGPILFSSYTLSRGIMKMTAQMPPIGDQDTQSVELQIRKGGSWKKIAEAPIHAQARTAEFRVEKWNDLKDVEYRLGYLLRHRNGDNRRTYWTGTVRRDPVDQPSICVADISCNYHTAFPNHQYVANTAKLDPDLLAFVGDQFYEATAGYGVTRAPLDLAINDYLRKWYCHGWTWRELMRDRPSLSLPDDHDVYQGNIWGEGGEGRKTTQAAGGYDQPVEWVNVVHRTQTSHHPDPYDPIPGKRGTTNYYGPLVYGGISFAVLADRQYKSGPEGKVPASSSKRGDHVVDPDFDPKTANIPGLSLLGEKQMQFLREWITDWRGAEMKAVISQTIFSGMATTHGPEQQILRIDYDANGWPQTPRNEALRIIRKAFAFHIAGDQHLPAVVQYGIDEHGDAPVAFAGPAVNVGYPRWWEPQKAKWTGAKRGSGLTGKFTDNFGHPLSVLAVKNGVVQPRKNVLEAMQDKASGLGVVRFNKQEREITIECWPYLADPTQPHTQMDTWPVRVKMLENYGRKPVAHLPALKINGVKNPVVQVIDETSGELVYVLRLNQSTWQPHVFAEGKYELKVSAPETGRERSFKGIDTANSRTAVLEITL